MAADRAAREGFCQPADFRWPAEWEPHEATWIAWPHNPDTWPGRLPAAQASSAEIVRALQGRELVRIAVNDAAGEERARRALADAGVDPERGIEFVALATDDAWMRDTAPLVVVRGEGAQRERVAVDFGFDAWGGKYPPWQRDAAVGRGVAAHLGLRRFASDLVLEGGSIEGDGRGSVLTTSACLLHPSRGERTREQLERVLADTLGARCVLWLGEGIAGDDTDGHVDVVARFVAPGAVVAAVEPDPHDENHAPLAANLLALRSMRDAEGKPLAVAELPMPPPLRAGAERLPASYANFYLANGVALAPVFGAPSDARALAVLRECLPGRDVIGIPSADLVRGLGAVHCLAQQEPR